MKAILIAVLLAAISFAAQAKSAAEVASVPNSILGGEILTLHKKPSIVIGAAENAAILHELGESGRKAFYKDIVMERSIDDLLSNYARTDRPATHAVIWRYESAESPLRRR